MLGMRVHCFLPFLLAYIVDYKYKSEDYIHTLLSPGHSLKMFVLDSEKFISVIQMDKEINSAYAITFQTTA